MSQRLNTRSTGTVKTFLKGNCPYSGCALADLGESPPRVKI